MTSSIESPRPNGFEAYVGPVTRVSDMDDTFTLSFTIEQQHLNGADMLHGGMMMSFASIVLAGAAREAAGGTVEALSVNCDFTGPGKLGDVVTATAEITRRTRSVVFLSRDDEA
ncbi:MAG: PaaI family thioesterase [Candidatus Phaeomarinobacter sp.]